MKRRFVIFGLCVATIMSMLPMIAIGVNCIVSDNYCADDDDGDYTIIDVSPEEAEIVGKNYVTGEIEYHQLIVNNENMSRASGEKIWQGYTPESVSVDTGSVSTCGVIGEDGRTMVTDTTVMPYSAVAVVNTTWHDGTSSFGTAWFVSKNVLVTAAHVVNDESGWATTVSVIPGSRVGGGPYGKHTPTNIYTTTAWTQGGNEYADFAVIVLGSDVGNETGWFSMRAIDNATNQSVVISGYPQRFYQYRMGGKITEHTSDGFIRYQIDTVGGQSGSPVYCSGNVVIGIHVAGIYYEDDEGNKIYTQNEGLAINDGIYNFIIGYVEEYN